MTDINDIYKSNSDYIKAEDIGDNMWTMTIKSAEPKQFDDGTSKIILSFHEWEKCLPLNVTNAKSIGALHGGNYTMWSGKQVMLFTTMVDYQGRPTLGIRVRAPMPAGGPQQRQPGQMQPQANANMGAGWNPNQSPQRPLNQTYQQASGGSAAYDERNPPPPTEVPF